MALQYGQVGWLWCELRNFRIGIDGQNHTACMRLSWPTARYILDVQYSVGFVRQDSCADTASLPSIVVTIIVDSGLKALMPITALGMTRPLIMIGNVKPFEGARRGERVSDKAG
jgi:hypothetical protein